MKFLFILVSAKRKRRIHPVVRDASSKSPRPSHRVLPLLQQIQRESDPFQLTPSAVLPEDVNTYFTYSGGLFAASPSPAGSDSEEGCKNESAAVTRVTWFVHGKTLTLTAHENRLLQKLKKKAVGRRLMLLQNKEEEFGEYGDDYYDELNKEEKDEEAAVLVFQLGEHRQLKATEGVSGRQKMNYNLAHFLHFSTGLIIAYCCSTYYHLV